MKLINKFLIIGAAVAALGFTACSDSEDEPQPSAKMENFFDVPAGDNSPEAQLRRDFYSKTGIYLVFNDVLREYTDEYGNKKTETIDFQWSALTGRTLNPYRFTYLDTYEDKKEVVEAMEKYLFPYINIPGGRFKPFSFFIANTIEMLEYGKWKPQSFIQSWRAMALPAQDWIDLDDVEAKELGRTALRSIIDAVLTDRSDELDEFFALAGGGPGEYLDEIFDDWDPDNPDVEAVYNLGFFGYTHSSWWGDYLFYKARDLSDYKDAIFNQTEAEFMARWGDYPLIVQRYNVLKQVIEDMGVNFNAVQ